jgi:flagella basal body P-ring formation protein FlgA
LAAAATLALAGRAAGRTAAGADPDWDGAVAAAVGLDVPQVVDSQAASAGAAPSSAASELAPAPLPVAPLGVFEALEPAGSRAAATAVAEAETAPQVARPARFTFKSAVEVRGARLLLGELATCTGAAVICEEAYGVDIGPSPEPGRTLHLHKGRLKELLAREWDEAAVEIVAPEGVRITSVGLTLDDATVAAALSERLQQEFAGNERFQVALERFILAAKPRVRSAEARIEFPELVEAAKQSPDWLAKHLTGQQRVDIVIVEADAARDAERSDPAGEPAGAERIHAQASFTLRQKLPVPTRNLLAGEILRESDFEDAWVVITRNAAKVAGSTADLTGRRLRRAAPVGAPVMLNQVEIPIVVRRGQLVRLTMRAGSLSVTGQVRALGSAGSGQVIEALYPATKKKIRVRVVDAATVEYLR